jgi:hypothetical protein
MLTWKIENHITIVSTASIEHKEGLGQYENGMIKKTSVTRQTPATLEIIQSTVSFVMEEEEELRRHCQSFLQRQDSQDLGAIDRELCLTTTSQTTTPTTQARQS